MPKAYIELHLHLDGAITPEIARMLADSQGILLPEDEKELERQLSVSEDCRSLNDFLQCFSLPLSLMQTAQAIEKAVYLVQENIRKDGVIYGEIRFAPQLHCQKGLTQEEAVQAALAGLSRSTLACNLILCCMRGEDTAEPNAETLRLAVKYLTEDGGVVAIDLAGAEGLYPTRDYETLFRTAKEKGVPFTIHAGEADGPESVQSAVEFGAARIGHGVRVRQDEKLMNQLAQKHICLEMCPTSNYQTRAVEDMSQYPIREFLKRGLCVTVNTDDMAISRTNIQKEFAYLRESLGLTEVEEEQLMENAIQSAFTTQERKDELRKRCFV